MSRLLISGGHVVDPANGVDEVRDLWIEGGRIVAAPENPEVRPDRKIDARGYVVMPGGVDVHCHIAGSKVNAARLLRPEDRREVSPRPPDRSARQGREHSAASRARSATGYKYAGLGYTTAVDAAIAPLGARHAHHELRDTPVIDKGFLVLLGNRIHLHAMDLIAPDLKTPACATTSPGCSTATRGAMESRSVEPGGDRVVGSSVRGTPETLDEAIDHFDVSPRRILTGLARSPPTNWSCRIRSTCTACTLVGPATRRRPWR